MRQYKQFIIPNRKIRTSDDILNKQVNYCNKSDCEKHCSTCLFDEANLMFFEEWYMNKNNQK